MPRLLVSQDEGTRGNDEAKPNSPPLSLPNPYLLPFPGNGVYPVLRTPYGVQLPVSAQLHHTDIFETYWGLTRSLENVYDLES